MTERDQDVIELKDNGYALITFQEQDHKTEKGVLKSAFGTGKDQEIKYMAWGKDDDLPLFREKLIEKNNIVPSLLQTRRDITAGKGLQAYREVYENGEVKNELLKMPAEAEDFFEENDIIDFISAAARELYLHSNLFVEGITSRDRKKIKSIKVLRCRDVRAGEQDDRGNIPYYVFSKEFGRHRRTQKADPKFIKIPALNPSSIQSKWMMHIFDDTLYDEYYPEPTWWGGQKWIELANVIPKFHLANLKHGYTLRYHIEVPNDYFRDNSSRDNTPESQKKAKKKETEAKQALKERLNEFLSGAENAGRALITYYDINKAIAKEMPGVKITPVKGELHDEALLKLFEKSNQANISGQSIHPTLANIETQGKMSSGTEIRNAYLMYLSIHTTHPRKLIMKVIDKVKRHNGWPKDIKYGFKDIEITKLDDNKAGSQNVVNDGE